MKVVITIGEMTNLMTPKQKIGRSMREIRDALNELDKTENEFKIKDRIKYEFTRLLEEHT